MADSTGILQPYPVLFDKSGQPLDAGYVYVGQYGLNPETSPINIYWDEDLTQPAPQPIRTINGYYSRNGTPAKIFISGASCSISVRDKSQSIVFNDLFSGGQVVAGGLSASLVIDSSGQTQQTMNNSFVFKVDSLNELKNLVPTVANRRVSIRNYGNYQLYWDATSTEVANDIDIFQSNTTPTGRWKWVKFESVAQGGVISDGVTDQTTRINQITARFGVLGYRGKLTIPENTKFNKASVFSSLPIGVNLNIFDNVNWGQPPSYKNRMQISYDTGATSDDTLHMFASNHHPAISFLNTGTSGSPSANERVGSILHAVGISYAGDPINAQILQFGTSTSDKWQTSIRALIPHAIALKDPSPWVSGKTYSAGDMCLSDGSKVYVTTAGGTAGATAPTGTATSINDGGVVWSYYAARRSRDSTIWTIDEDGNAANYGNTAATTTYQVRNAANRAIIEVDAATGAISYRDYNRNNRIILGSDDARGIYNDGVNSVRFSNLSGATPTLVVTGGRVINATPTNMTGLNLPTGQTSGMCYLHFADANTTLKHGAFQLKGGVDVTPPANGFMVFIRNISVGGAWYEVSRSF